MPVTAQHIWDSMDANECLSLKDGTTSLEDMNKQEVLNGFEKLLSRARQEARREALKEMDDAVVEVLSDDLAGLSPDEIQQTKPGKNLLKLRKEYSNQP